MPALQVRDFPADLYEELRIYAEQNHRSIAQQTIACVERELARSKAVENAHILDPYGVLSANPEIDIEIPLSVKEAAARARMLEPSNWMLGFETESEAEQKARKAKRKKLKEGIAALSEQWKGAAPSAKEISAMVHEDLDERADRIIKNAERFSTALKEA